MDVINLIVPVTIVAIGGVVFYLFKVGLKEKTYEENAAEQKKKYASKLKPKYTQQKKPPKAPTKEKSNVEKKSKVTFQSPISKEIKKPETPSISSAVDKPVRIFFPFLINFLRNCRLNSNYFPRMVTPT